MTTGQEGNDQVEELGATFALENEDHTLANALRFFLNKNPHVSFCGYSIPHPSEPVTNLRIQTTGLITPREALEEACKSLKAVCAHMKQTFRSEMDAKREGGGAAADEMET
jgi:DNA-directed RNA polymerase I and III subunit RPAC2